MPTAAHWALRAEECADLVKIELAAVLEEFAAMPNKSALKHAVLNINRRHMPQYITTRQALPAGRRANWAFSEPPISSLNTLGLPPSLANVDKFLDAMHSRISLQVQQEGNLRIKKAFSARLSSH